MARKIGMSRSAIPLVVLLVTSVALCAQEASPPATPASPAAATPTRYLVVVMDGVGYDLAAEMHRQGDLKNFLPPAPLIVAFPSDTNPALVEILAPVGAVPAPGYEDHHFDPADNKMRGGIFHRFSRKDFIEDNYRGLFDYHPHPVRMTVEYAVPVLGPWLNGTLNLSRIKNEFRESDEALFLAYFDATDTAAHLGGKWLVRAQMRQLDRLAGELRRKDNVEIVVLSDHGNDHRWLRRTNLEPSLRRAGFRVEGKLTDDRSVVLPQYGLISNAVLYTRPGREAAAARAVLEATGVDLAAYRDGDSLVVVSEKGRARITRRVDPDGTEYFRYQAEEGLPGAEAPGAHDPLQLKCIVDEFSRAGFADAEGFISEDNWLEATAGHVYPDPLRRLWRASNGLVEHPASVLVSLEDGYYTGSIWLNMFAWMQATHGSLRRAQSLGIVLSTTPALFDSRVPFTGENVLERILSLQRAGAEAAEDVATVPGVEVAPGVPNQP
jgi:hypothetical protein